MSDDFYTEIVSDEEDAYDITHVLKIYHKGELLDEFYDSICPEDISFYRDLGWVPDIIEKAYALGFGDGKSDK